MSIVANETGKYPKFLMGVDNSGVHLYVKLAEHGSRMPVKTFGVTWDAYCRAMHSIGAPTGEYLDVTFNVD